MCVQARMSVGKRWRTGEYKRSAFDSTQVLNSATGNNNILDTMGRAAWTICHTQEWDVACLLWELWNDLIKFMEFK